MKLAILGGGGARMPAFVRSMLTAGKGTFDQISLFEPDPVRRETTGRLAVELAAHLGQPGAVSMTVDPEEAFTEADFVFSAIRVGGDRGRVIDEQVALRHGLVGQETTGPGGAAMALRTVPVVLAYCEMLARCSPGAVLINFTNPAGLITQTISSHSSVRVVGVCDTPVDVLERIGEFLGAEPGSAAYGYSGLNHLGWVTSFSVNGDERMGELLARYEELGRFDHRFEVFDPGMVRRLGAIPTEYLFYYYDPERYIASVARAGTSRGQDVMRLNEELIGAIGRSFDRGDVEDAWSAYSTVLGVRSDTYMRTDTEGANRQEEARSQRAEGPPAAIGTAEIGGYEGVALDVVAGLTGRRPGEVIVNTPNGASMSLLDADDVVEVPSLIDGAGVQPLASAELPRSARALVMQVKEYETALVEAAFTGDAGLAELALSLHPLVPGITAARELLAEYRELHGPYLAYLH
ncbi:MAG TPA: hypothetical protein VL984_13710 [Acidimicrobiales bacterium]|nr:hypothetical protein [Acidimicrobiales bacterium]